MRLADNDQLTAQLQFKRAGEAMAECRPPISSSTLRADLQQTRLPIIGGEHDSSIFDPARQLHGCVAADAIHPVVEISPPEAVARLTVAGYGMVAESAVRFTSRGKIQHHFRAPMHMLVMYEKGERRDGETFVEGLPRSALRNLERKLTFVPAGREFHDWQEPRGSQMRLMYFYFEPEKSESSFYAWHRRPTGRSTPTIRRRNAVEHRAQAEDVRRELCRRLDLLQGSRYSAHT